MTAWHKKVYCNETPNFECNFDHKVPKTFTFSIKFFKNNCVAKTSSSQFQVISKRSVWLGWKWFIQFKCLRIGLCLFLQFQYKTLQEPLAIFCIETVKKTKSSIKTFKVTRVKEHRLEVEKDSFILKIWKMYIVFFQVLPLIQNFTLQKNCWLTKKLDISNFFLMKRKKNFWYSRKTKILSISIVID